MSWKNEIMDELHRVKDEYAAKFDFDIDRMVAHLQHEEELEKRKGRKFVSFPPRRCRTEFPFTAIEEESAQLAPPVVTLRLTSENSASVPSP